MEFQAHYQNGYVTRSLDRALETFSHRFGIEGLSRYDADIVVETPEGAKPLVMKIAAGWSGKLNIEVIEPVAGATAHLISMLPPDPEDPAPRLHHVALRRDDLDSMRREIVDGGYPLAFGGQPEGMEFAYLDTRKAFGHYLELVWKQQGGWEKIGWPADRPLT